MVRVHHCAECFLLELPCAICEGSLRLDLAWLAFPAQGDVVSGMFVHKGCIDGQCGALFGHNHYVLMRGHVALTRIAESLGGPMAIDR